MPFLGIQPTDTFASVAKQTITGDGSVTYTLTHPVANANDLAVFVNNVRQEPTVAYSASGTSITFTEAIASTDDCYVVYIARTFQTVTAPDNSVNADQLSYPLTNFSSTGIDDNADATAITIDSSERVGIGKTTPVAQLDVANGTAYTASGDFLARIQQNTNATGKNGLSVMNAWAATASTMFECAMGWDGSSVGYYPVVTVDGLGRTYFKPQRTEKVRIDEDGLKFNADTAAANALDDYEEGSFTVTLRGSTAEPATLVSDASNYYTKIGNVVKARISLENVDTTGYAGDVSFNGLPFTSVNNTRTIGTLIGYRSMTTSATATTGVVAMIFPNSSTITTREGDSNSAWLTPQHSAATGRYFFVDIVYMTA